MIQNANDDHHSQSSDTKSDDNEETLYIRIRYNGEVDEMDENSEDEKDTGETSKKLAGFVFFCIHIFKCKIGLTTKQHIVDFYLFVVCRFESSRVFSLSIAVCVSSKLCSRASFDDNIIFAAYISFLRECVFFFAQVYFLSKKK